MLTNLAELWRYRELIQNLVVRDLRARYKNSVLGIAWSWVNPLLMMIVFTVVFNVLTGQVEGLPYYPMFILSGILPWNFFSASVTGAIGSIVGNGHLIKKVYFPREVLPVSIVLANMVNFLIALPVFFVLALLFGLQLSPWLALLPVVLITQVMFSIGIGLILATLNVFYRDTQIIMEVIMLAWFFLTPIFWDVAILPDSKVIGGIVLPVQRLVYILNPMASIVNAYRDILYRGGIYGASFQPAMDFLSRTIVTAFVCMLLGYAVFHRYSYTFGEEV
ncbi:MAG: ABC transporter permease [Thermoflexales bacterium]|nr:ABC transporter permease [Thermoflexales bacterium]